MQSVRKPWWKQATALVTVSTGGAITGFTFVPGAAATMTSPSTVPLHLLALEKAAAQDATPDASLRSAIVNVAGYYLRLARTRTPAQMEALIWGSDSLDGADHGAWCAAFASLTLELAAQAVGEQSWVSGGPTYPWPLHRWADARVDPNQESLGVTSIVQDAQAHQRWHPAGDGYRPQPGDWVVFAGHVEVVTSYAKGTLDTIGADSLPNLTVNAHSFVDPLAQQGVEGFVDNGHLDGSQAAAGGGQAVAASSATDAAPAPGQPAASPATGTHGSHAAAGRDPASQLGLAEIPGDTAPGGLAAAPAATAPVASAQAQPYRKHTAPDTATAPGTRAQQAFMNQVAPGAIAAQQRFGVPASVTIAQAIDESGWGSSQLAVQDYNLFGIKGSGPAGSVTLPTREYENGQWLTVYSPFRVYHNVSESISDHAELLATSGYYQRAMADRAVPDAFANDLTGVYATDPEYGANLIALMRLYDLYRFDSPSAPAPAQTQAPASPAQTATQPPVPAHTPAAHQPAAHQPAAEPSIPGVVPAASSAPPTTHARNAAPASSAAQGHGTAHAHSAPPVSGTAAIPGTAAPQGGTATQEGTAIQPSTTARPGTSPRVSPAHTRQVSAAAGRSRAARGGARIPGLVTPSSLRYEAALPPVVATAFFAKAKSPLARAELLHRDVAGETGIPWQLLAACDWMQCHADPRYSPVNGERLGTLNSDGTVFATKSAALAQCAADLIELALAVYGLDLTAPGILSVRAIADAFAAFRWGGLLKRHRVSAMEFPYSVAGLTAQHLKMHWPVIHDPDAPDKPGARFRMPFGAVPAALSLNYPATV